MSAQDKLDRRAAKHGLGSDERKRKIQKAKDFFSKPVPTYSKDELRKMGHPVEQKEGRFDIVIPPPKGKASTAKTTARNRANSAKHADKIKKATAKDMARSASGSLKRTDDSRRKNYQSGKSGAYFSKYENVEEKAVSKSQQKFMGMVRAVQKGDMKQAPSPEVAKAAKTMSKKDVKDFASTKHKGLPESSVEYGKSMDRIKDKEKNAAIKPKDRETLGKLADLMKKQKRNEAYRKPTQAEIDADKRKDGKSKDSSTRYRDMKKKMYGNAMGGLKNEEKKYSVKYTHPTDKKSGKTTGPLSKAAADKKAAMGNRVDRVGGKYTVIPHVEAAGQEYTAVPIKTGDVSQADRLTIAKMDAIMKKRSKDKRQKEENIHYVKVGDGRDHMIVKTKADKPSDAVKKIKSQYPKDRVRLHKEEVDEATMADRTVLRAVRIAKDMAGNHTGASKRIEKMKKGLSDHPKVKDALRVANESVSSADKKPQNFRDPETGKLKVRMVPVDRDVVRGDDKARVVRKKRFKNMRKR